MTIDDLARRAAADLLEDTERRLEVDATRRRLDVARRRRRAAVSGAAAGAVAVALLVVSLLVGGGRGVPVPAPDVRHTTATATTSAAPHGEELLVDGLYAPTWSVTPPVGCEHPGVAFSPDGGRLAYTCPTGTGAGTYVLDVPDGQARLVGSRGHGVAWTADGTRLVVAGDDHLIVIPVDGSGGAGRTVPLPSGWVMSSVDARADDLLLLGGAIRGTSAVMTLRIDGSDPRVVRTQPTRSLMDPRWSPDGRAIGYVQRDAALVDGTIAAVSVWTMRTDGSGAHLVHRHGAAAFLGVSPSFDWSPQGRMAYVTVEDGPAAVVVLKPDGTLDEVRSGANGPVAWRPAG